MPPHSRTSPGRVPGHRRAPRRAALGLLLGALLLAPAAPASGEAPDDFSAADQYVETLPTSRGPSATKTRKRGTTPLPAGVAAKLSSQGGSDAAALETVATSSDFGASHGTGGRADKRQGKAESGSSGSSPAIPSASVEAVSESGGDLLWVLLALLAITGLMVGAVAYQRHRHKNSG
jgi:hypothetical protein